MTKAIISAWHKYQPYGGIYYEPILTFFLNQMQKFKDEYDKLYLIDSTWNISPETHHLPDNVMVIKVNPSLRYYDAYKEILPQIKEDLVLLLDNDTIVYKQGIIKKVFDLLTTPQDHLHLSETDVVSIIDQIGEYKTDKLKNGNKFCPYFFATRRELLKKYDFLDWGSDMPYCETFGHLTEFMLENGIKPYEWEEDKSSLLFDGTEQYPEQHIEGGLGYYHIRAGSTTAVLLAWKDHQSEEYWKHLKNQPRNEYLRQLAWYELMGENRPQKQWVEEIILDLGIDLQKWLLYLYDFKKFHGL